MILTKKEHPEIFKNLREYETDLELNDHRKGSTFYRISIIKFEAEDAKNFPEIEDFSQYIGEWRTGEFVYSDDDPSYAYEYEITELAKVDASLPMLSDSKVLVLGRKDIHADYQNTAFNEITLEHHFTMSAEFIKTIQSADIIFFIEQDQTAIFKNRFGQIGSVGRQNIR